MTYGSILVPIDEQPAAAGSIEAAFRLASDLGAHLEGIAIVPSLDLPQRMRPRQSARAILKRQWERDKVEARAAAKRFEAQARKAGVSSVEGVMVVAEAPAETILAFRARTADLVVLPRPGEDDIGILGTHAVETALLVVGRPVLLVPEPGLAKGFPTKALVAWNGSRESARALTDALPLLERAKSVVVFTAAPAGEDGPIHGANAAVRYLARHAITAETQHAAVADDRAGQAILGRARKLDADLVVMGAYGRSRLTELVLGGATKSVLAGAEVAVLMSH